MKIKTKRGARRIRNQRVTTRRFVTLERHSNSYKVDDYTTFDNGVIVLQLKLPNGDIATTQMVDPLCAHGIDFSWGVI